ncbi:hypothetical protein IWX90DRAFT_194735 [Phyllosticta citrichinensis]|uniref:Uncharacterized protein n=1 Tax=Phyllosticta citrichinensis TaxID=1130410 RepID=A0ABR1XX54_9PEZI
MSPSKEPPQSDYDTDTNQNDINLAVPVAGPRTTEVLNLSVLRRQDPNITGILSIAPYVVLYQISVETSTWEKSGTEGTMFVVQLTNSEIGSTRFAVVILNRRSLDNFIAELKTPEDVEVNEDFVILSVPTINQEESQIYGLWIFSEPPPSSTAESREINARMIQECARMAETSRKAMQQLNPDYASSDHQEAPQSVAMGRQVSLRELFGQQREADADFSIHEHGAPPASSLPKPPAHVMPTPMFAPTADTQFFHAAPATKSPAANLSTAPSAGIQHHQYQAPAVQHAPFQQQSPAQHQHGAVQPAPTNDVMGRDALLKLFTQRTDFDAPVETPFGTFTNFIQADDARMRAWSRANRPPPGSSPTYVTTFVKRLPNGKKLPPVVTITKGSSGGPPGSSSGEKPAAD